MKNRVIARIFHMAIVLLFVFCAWPKYGFASTQSPSSDKKLGSLESSIETYMKAVEKIRQLNFRKKIPVKTLTQERLKKALQKSIREMKEKLGPTQEMLQLLGLLKESDSLERFFKEFYASQVGGMYDPDTKTFYIRTDLNGIDLQSIAVHELDHALIDQYFDLNAFLKTEEVKNDSEMQIARQAVAEGEATLVMMSYMMANMTGEELEDITNAVVDINTSMFEGLISNMMLSSLGIEVPRWLLRLMMSPYVDGLNFVGAVLKREGWEGINQLYTNPPQTSEHLLHPERYFAREPIRYEELEAFLPDVRSRFTDHIGELGWRIFFQHFGQKECAEPSADGWDGDRVILFRNGENRLNLFIALVYDNPQEAREFLTCFEKAMSVREKMKGLIPVRWSARLSGDKVLITIASEK